MADARPASTLVLDEFLPFRLSYTSNLVSEAIARTYEALFGLSIPEWRLVAVVAEAGRIAQGAVGQRTRMDKVTVSRAAAALVGRGLMARAPNAADRRSHLLELTTAGRDLYAAVAPKALELERRVFDRLDRGEVRRFAETLRRIEAAVLSAEEEA